MNRYKVEWFPVTPRCFNDVGHRHSCRRGGNGPIATPLENGIAWAAGIWEGEGSCQSQKGGYHVSAYQSDAEVLDRLCIMFGGSVLMRPSRDPKYQPGYTWDLNGCDARRFLDMIYPYLSLKRKIQILEMLSTQKAYKRG